MKSLPVLSPPAKLLDHARSSLRLHVCPHCTDCPADHRRLGGDQPKPCEPNCALFQNLPHLLAAGRCVDDMVGSFDAAMHRYLVRLAENSSVQRHARMRRAGWVNEVNHITEILKDLID